MRSAPAHRLASELHARRGKPGDLDALLELEGAAFATDHISRRGFRRFLHSPNAETIVVEHDDGLVGYALITFRSGSAVARLYSIAVAAHSAGRGVGRTLLAAAEEAALARGCVIMRLEVHEQNAAAIARYRKSGYIQFGRYPAYYQDKGDALRFEKRLTPTLAALKQPPPYFHQTTEFTCGPACIMMALAWADPALRRNPALEFRLWREATTIFMTSGPGGCEPYGLAVALARRGLRPEVHVSHGGPYFLDTVQSEDKRRVMRLTQADFRRDAEELGIPTHLTPLDESAFMRAFDTEAVAIVLVCGHHMVRRRTPHWVFAFGHEGRYILVHDPVASKDDQGIASVRQTYAVPAIEFERMTRFGRDHLRAAVLIWKGPLQ
jgi:ribosomal protein S18 acetylase RimI-like enzyme